MNTSKVIELGKVSEETKGMGFGLEGAGFHEKPAG